MKRFLIAIAVLTSVTALTVYAQDAKKAPAKSEVKKEQCDKKKECCKEKADKKTCCKATADKKQCCKEAAKKETK